MTNQYFEMAQKISLRNNVSRVVSIAKIGNILKKWVASGKKKFYLGEIKKVLKHEIVRNNNPYYCSKCKKKHYRGEAYEKHENLMIIPSDLEKVEL